MKKLYIIRHAKSSWKDTSLDDIDRPLNKRGNKDAPLMGQILRGANVKPDLIFSSPALRANATAKLIALEVGYTKKIECMEKIYETSVSTLQKIVTQIKDENSVVFLVGHNPELNMLAQMYVEFEKNIPTCGVLEIDFSCESWSKADANNAKLISFEYPKKYPY